MPTPKFKNRYYVDVYRHAYDGLNKTQISKKIGVSLHTFSRWLKRDSDLKYAMKTGKADLKLIKKPPKTEAELANNFLDYVYGQLPDELKDVFDHLNIADKPESNVRKVERMLSKHSVEDRQRLLLHSYVYSCFDMSSAMRMAHVKKETLDRWVKNDINFAEILNELNWHRKNYVEGALFRRIEAGDTKAIIFANECINRDRGFIKRVDVRVEETQTSNIDWDIADLDLEPEVMEKVLKAIEQKEQQMDLITIEGSVA